METAEDDYTPKTPFVKNVDCVVNNERVEFEKMELPEAFEPKFWLPQNLPFDAPTMTDMFLPDAFVDDIAKSSSAYAKRMFQNGSTAQSKGKMC